MGFFDDDKKMYIPLSIDNAESVKGSYFLSNKKVVEMCVALIPYMFMMYPMLQGGVRLPPMIVVTLGYIFIYGYFFRYRIMEESRLRNMLREIDKNRVSGVDHFWGINKVGSKGQDDGVIHYQREVKTTRGLVVAFDRGSTVGVAKGNYRRFRETKMSFLRELSLQKFNFQWYEIPKRSGTPDSLINYFNIMTKMENQYFKKLLKLQIDINTIFTNDADQRYVDYIVIRNSNFKTMRRFKTVIQGIIDSTLATNGYIVDPRILNKREVDDFFEDVLMIGSLDSNNIRKNVESVPFENYAKITRVVRKDGRDLPIEFMDDFDLMDYSGMVSIEGMIEKDEQKLEYKKNDVDRREKIELDKARIKRNKDLISDKEYIDEQNEIKKKFKEERESIYITNDGDDGKIEDEELITGLSLEKMMSEDEEVEINPTIVVNTRKEMVDDMVNREQNELLDRLEDEELSLEQLLEKYDKK